MSFSSIVNGDNITADKLALILGIKNYQIQTSGSFTMKECFENNVKVLFPSSVPFYDLSWNDMNKYGFIEGKIVLYNNSYYNVKIISGIDNEQYGGEFKELNGHIARIRDLCFRDACNEPEMCWSYNTSWGNVKKVNKTDKLAQMFIFREVSDISIKLNDNYSGDYTTPPIIKYSIHGNKLSNTSIIEKLDGKILNTRDNLLDNNNVTLDISAQFDNLNYGSHNLDIEFFNNNILMDTVRILFNKIKAPVEILPPTSNLKQILAHNKEIDKEIEYQLSIFENKLKEMGIQVLPEEKKLSTLISKIGEIIIEKHDIPNWYIPSNLWITAKDIPYGSSDASCSVYDNKIYLLGGDTNNSKSTLNRCYDIDKNEWSDKTPISENCSLHTSSTVNGKIYVIDGLYRHKTGCYDPALNAWSEKALSITQRYKITSSAAYNKIYVLGGDSSSYYRKNECYDPDINAWSTKADSPSSYTYSSSTEFGNLIYFVVPGTASLFYYDPILDAWSTGNKPTSDSSSSVDMVNVSNKLYLFTKSRMSIYDIDTNTWSSQIHVSDISDGISCASSIKNNIYLLGGPYNSTKNRVYIP